MEKIRKIAAMEYTSGNELKETTMYLQKSGLNGRTAFITGGARGIGLATAQALAEAGAKVIISDMNAETLAEGSATLKSRGYAAARCDRLCHL